MLFSENVQVEFVKRVESLALSDDIGYIDAVLAVCEEYEIEPGMASKFLSKPIIEKLEKEGREYNLFSKNSGTWKRFGNSPIFFTNSNFEQWVFFFFFNSTDLAIKILEEFSGACLPFWELSDLDLCEEELEIPSAEFQAAYCILGALLDNDLNFFEEIKQKYLVVFRRDPVFFGWLEKIGRLHLGLAPKPEPNVLENLMQIFKK